MKKNIIFLWVLSLVFTLIPIRISAESVADVWDGSSKAPTKTVTVNGVPYYQISTAEELAYLSYGYTNWMDRNYILTNDIMLNTVELTYDKNGKLTVDVSSLKAWKPINRFVGTFDGGGYTISGMYIDSTSEEGTGFISQSAGCEIKNLTISNSYVKGNNYVGGFVGRLWGGYSSRYDKILLENCFFDGAVVGLGKVGGLCGTVDKIRSCGNYGDVWGSGDDVGGIAGSISGGWSVENSFNEGNITAVAGKNIGGVVGRGDDFSNCENKGNVTGKENVGGICGDCDDYDTIEGSSNFGKIVGEEYVGGIVGSIGGSSADVENSYNYGQVVGGSYVGGIAGSSGNAHLWRNNNIGQVSGSMKGGISGYSSAIFMEFAVVSCYYFKTSSFNSNLYAFGNYNGTLEVAQGRGEDFFCFYADKTLNKSGHRWGFSNQTKAPTCVETGLKTVTCLTCKMEKEEIVAVNKNNHNFGEWQVLTEATCSSFGEKERVCLDCSHSEKADILKKTHDFAAPTITKQPTCTESGIESGKCVNCDKETTNKVNPLGHKLENFVVTVEPTCSAEGKREGACTVCGQKAEEVIAIAENAHTFGEYEIIKEATELEDGVKIATCSACGAITEEVLHYSGSDTISTSDVTETDGLFEETNSNAEDSATTLIDNISEKEKDNKTLLMVVSVVGVLLAGCVVLTIVIVKKKK